MQRILVTIAAILLEKLTECITHLLILRCISFFWLFVNVKQFFDDLPASSVVGSHFRQLRGKIFLPRLFDELISTSAGESICTLVDVSPVMTILALKLMTGSMG